MPPFTASGETSLRNRRRTVAVHSFIPDYKIHYDTVNHYFFFLIRPSLQKDRDGDRTQFPNIIRLIRSLQNARSLLIIIKYHCTAGFEHRNRCKIHCGFVENISTTGLNIMYRYLSGALL